MPEASNSVVIRRPPREVYDFLADATNDSRWRPGVLDIARASGEGVGTVYRQGVKGPGGRRVAADIEITDLRPGQRIGFRTISGPVRPDGAYELAEADGGTRVTFTLRCGLRGAKRLMSPVVAANMRREVANLERLRQALER